MKIGEYQLLKLHRFTFGFSTLCLSSLLILSALAQQHALSQVDSLVGDSSDAIKFRTQYLKPCAARSKFQPSDMCYCSDFAFDIKQTCLASACGRDVQVACMEGAAASCLCDLGFFQTGCSQCVYYPNGTCSSTLTVQPTPRPSVVQGIAAWASIYQYIVNLMRAEFGVQCVLSIVFIVWAAVIHFKYHENTDPEPKYSKGTRMTLSLIGFVISCILLGVAMSAFSDPVYTAPAGCALSVRPFALFQQAARDSITVALSVLWSKAASRAVVLIQAL